MNKSKLYMPEGGITLKEFGTPEEIKLFIDNGFASEIGNEFFGFHFSNEQTRIFKFNELPYYFIIRGNRLFIDDNDNLHFGAVLTSWMNEDMDVIPFIEIFDEANQDLMEVIVTRPDLFMT